MINQTTQLVTLLRKLTLWGAVEWVGRVWFTTSKQRWVPELQNWELDFLKIQACSYLGLWFSSTEPARVTIWVQFPPPPHNIRGYVDLAFWYGPSSTYWWCSTLPWGSLRLNSYSDTPLFQPKELVAAWRLTFTFSFNKGQINRIWRQMCPACIIMNNCGDAMALTCCSDEYSLRTWIKR